MKAYKEWVFSNASDGWIRDEFTGAEAGWRAALEWALHQKHIDPESQTISNPGGFYVIDANIIEKELADDSPDDS